jgi:Zn-dependent metalloprotease
MKKIIILVFGMIISLGIQAQLKTVNPGSNFNKLEAEITPPASKFNTGKSSRASGTFVPRQMEFAKNSQNGLKVEMRSVDKQLPIWIKGNPTLTLRSGADPESRSLNFLENAKGLMKIQNPSEEFRVMQIRTDKLGFTHVKLRQEKNGLPIYGSEVVFHYSEKESFLNGRYEVSPELESYEPTITSATAEDISVEDVGGLTSLDNDKFGLFDFEKVKSELVIYEGKLAFHMSVYKNIVDLWEYFVDAHTGEIIHKHTNICKFHNHHSSDESCSSIEETEFAVPPPNGPIISNATDLFGTARQINTYAIGGVYYMIDAARTMFDGMNSNLPDDPVGTVWTIDAFNTSPENSNFQYDHVSSNNINFSGKNTGVSAQYNGGEAYQYFKNTHGRESINGFGGNVIGLINIADDDGSSLGNAFWNGIAMFYGNGDNSFKPLARGLDVAGHEMSHGVVQSTANLEYQGESGALNESFADVFGAMIDREDWLIGEDVVFTSAFPSGALRSLQDPHNGAATGDFNRGWQPKKYSERYTGSEDNGGVHLNSGIPNHAFYLFANDGSVGKERAEKVYYRALDVYLTKSSKFIDARLAVVQAAQDLYGTTVANKAKAAFDQVEIFDGNGTNNQTDVEVNPGADLILFTTEDQNNLYIAERGGNLIFNPLTQQDPISVPSITDDGTEIVFVNQDKKLYYIKLDWETNSIAEEGVLGFTETYRNVVFSRDGLRMAVLRDNPDNEIFVFDWVTLTGVNYELYNPTFTQGVSTGDVLYADAMQFDFSGEYLMYDAFNQLQSTSGSDIDYWDIGFIKVFNNDSETFTLGNDIQKLFSQLPEGVSVGNPTFSKNSDYIIAFDLLENNSFSVLGANSETGKVGEIFTGNDRPGYPSYSNNDDILLFDATDGVIEVIAGAELENDKITSNAANVFLAFEDIGIKWGVWFGNGDRVLSDVENILPESSFEVYPNPVSQKLQISSEVNEEQLSVIRITDMMGKTIYNRPVRMNGEFSLDVSSLSAGQYVISIITKEGSASKIFIKL